MGVGRTWWRRRGLRGWRRGLLRATLYRAGPAQRGNLALVGATVLAGDNLQAIPDGVVLVRDGVVVEVGPSGEVEVPSDEHNWITDLRSQVDDGTLEGPRVFISGPLFTTVGGHPIATIGVESTSDAVRVPATPGEARQIVRALATGDDPVDVIKVVQDRGGPDQPLEPITPDVLDAIITEAHTHGLPVTAHWGTLDDLDELLAAGIDGLEHVESRDLLDGWSADVLAELVERGLPITATLTVSEAALPAEVMPEALASLQQRVDEFHAAGGRIVVGSDAGRPGVHFDDGVHRELELLVDSGTTPREALAAAAVDAAGVLGPDHLGVIRPGGAADLVMVDGDPIADIGAIRAVMMTFRDGRLVVDLRGNG